MKIKVKGLVFVGFAAAIMSANAMAVDNTVTSKEYVDTYFQTKANLTTSINTENPSATKYPSESAITAYVTTAGGQFQTKSQAADENKVADGTGGWKALNSNIATATDTGNGATTAAIKTYVGAEISDALQNGVDGSGYVTATYDSTNNETTVALDSTQITSSSTLTDNSTKLAREGDVKGYVDTQDALKVSIAQGSGNANKTLITDGNGNVTVSSQATSVIPALPNTCTAGTPCALVTNESTNEIEWVPIAQSTDSVGA